MLSELSPCKWGGMVEAQLFSLFEALIIHCSANWNNLVLTGGFLWHTCSDLANTKHGGTASKLWAICLNESHNFHARWFSMLISVIWYKFQLLCDCVTRIFTACAAHQILFRSANREEWDGRGTQHVRRRRQLHTGFRCTNLRERDRFEDLSASWKIILKWIFKKLHGYTVHQQCWTLLLPTDAHNVKKHRVIKTF